MNADAVLGIDLGTSVVKAGIYGFDGVTHASGSCPLTATAYAAATESYLRWSARWAAGYRTESALSEKHGTGVII